MRICKVLQKYFITCNPLACLYSCITASMLSIKPVYKARKAHKWKINFLQNYIFQKFTNWGWLFSPGKPFLSQAYLVWKLQQRKVGGPSHRIKTHRSTQPKKRNRWHAMIRNDSSWKCWRHGPSQCAYERHSPPGRPPFWILSKGECLS